MYLPAWISLKSAVTRGACAEALSSVSRGVKGVPTKLEGGVICWCSFREGRDVDIGVCHATGRPASQS